MAYLHPHQRPTAVPGDGAKSVVFEGQLPVGVHLYGGGASLADLVQRHQLAMLLGPSAPSQITKPNAKALNIKLRQI
jgi:hypothetical protein